LIWIEIMRAFFTPMLESLACRSLCAMTGLPIPSRPSSPFRPEGTRLTRSLALAVPFRCVTQSASWTWATALAVVTMWIGWSCRCSFAEKFQITTPRTTSTIQNSKLFNVEFTQGLPKA